MVKYLTFFFFKIKAARERMYHPRKDEVDGLVRARSSDHGGIGLTGAERSRALEWSLGKDNECFTQYCEVKHPCK